MRHPRTDWLFSKSSESIISQCIAAIADRRRRLQDLAIASLPLAALHELDLGSDQLVDEKASMLQQIFSDNQVSLPPSLAIPATRTTIYHHTCLTPENAERLYNLGFKDICGRDCDNMTPLATIRTSPKNNIYSWLKKKEEVEAGVAYASWLVSKEPGALRSAQRVRRNTSHTPVLNSAAHCFASQIGDVRHTPLPLFSPPPSLSGIKRPSASFDMMRAVLAADWTDDCTCACSRNGCLPHKTFLGRPDSDYYYRSKKASDYDSDMRWHFPIMKWLESSQDSGFLVPMNVWTDLIRLETFNALDLTHVCCDECGRRIGDSEAEDIRDEERDLINHLETLMSEFETEFSNSDLSIVTFLKGYWKRRIMQVLSEQDEDEYAKLREIGVVLDSDPPLSVSAPSDSDTEECSDPHANTYSGGIGNLDLDKEQVSEALSDSNDEIFELGEGCDSGPCQ
ncbi:MAG: hypothetical protein Q9165_007442 [Trypethelium subeluteriae]